jgi:hypothetical protein
MAASRSISAVSDNTENGQQISCSGAELKYTDSVHEWPKSLLMEWTGTVSNDELEIIW